MEANWAQIGCKWIRLDSRRPTWVQMDPDLFQVDPKLGPWWYPICAQLYPNLEVDRQEHSAYICVHIYLCIYVYIYIYISVWPCLEWFVVYTNLKTQMSQHEFIVVLTFISNTLNTLIHIWISIYVYRNVANGPF